MTECQACRDGWPRIQRGNDWWHDVNGSMRSCLVGCAPVSNERSESSGSLQSASANDKPSLPPPSDVEGIETRTMTNEKDDGAASPATTEPLPNDEPFRVEVDKSGCERCGHGTQWTVVGPGEIAIGQSFEDQELAEEIAEYMNQGYRAGCGGE